MTVIRHSAAVRSISSEPVRLRIAASSCSCTTYRVDPEILAPGEEAQVAIEVQIASAGPQRTEFVFLAAAPAQAMSEVISGPEVPEQIVRIGVSYRSDAIVISPHRIEVRAAQGEVWCSELVVRSGGGLPLVIEGIRFTDLEGASWARVPLRGRGEAEGEGLRLCIQADTGMSPTRGAIMVSVVEQPPQDGSSEPAHSPRRAEFTVPVDVLPFARLSASPPGMVLSAGPERASADLASRYAFEIRCASGFNDGAWPGVLSAECDSPGIHAVWCPAGTGKLAGTLFAEVAPDIAIGVHRVRLVDASGGAWVDVPFVVEWNNQ